MYSDHIISHEEHELWFDKILEDPTVKYKICELKGTPIGLVNFTEINKLHNRCFWGFYLGKSDLPTKAGPIMEFLALEYAFKTLTVKKLCCEVLSFNSRVIKLHKKFGFREEGIFLKHIFKSGKYVDVVSLAMFDEEWTEKEPLMRKLLFR